jgi:hypothetical protein
MSAQAARRGTLMSLRELVDRYLSLAGHFGQAVPLSSFALSAPEAESLFSAFDEDYHISRFFHFSSFGGAQFSINGVPATHLSLDAEINSIL